MCLRHFVMTGLAACLWLVSGCGSSEPAATSLGNLGGAQSGSQTASQILAQLQIQPKALAITSPSGSRGFTVNSASVRLEGFASDGIDSVSWSGNGRTGPAVLSGQQWSIAALPLAVGDNLVTVSGNDALGTAANASTVITYNPTVVDISPLTSEPSDLFINEATPTKFLVSFDDASPVDPNSVQLLQVDPVTRAIQRTLGPLNGVGNDFSGQFTLTAASDDLLAFRVRATVGGQEIFSPLLQLRPLRKLTQADLDILNTVPDLAQAVYDQELAQTNSRPQAQAAALAFLNAHPDVLVAEGAPDNGFGIWIVYKNETLGALLLSPPGTKGSLDPKSKAITFLSSGHAVPDSVLGAFVDAFIKDFETSEDAEPVSKIVKDPGSAINQVAATTWRGPFLIGQDANLDFLRTKLRGLGIIYYSSHGDALFDIKGYLKVPRTSSAPVETLSRALTHYDWDYEGAQVIALTAEKQKEKLEDVAEGTKADLAAARVCVSQKKLYGVTPAFFKHYYGENGKPLSHCIVNMNTCRSTFNDSLSSAFLKIGALTYFGYNQYVSSSFCLSSCTEFYGKLFGTQSASGESLTTAAAFQQGQHDDGSPPAYFQLKGAGNVVVMAGRAKINSFSPTSGVAGDTVTISGEFLGGRSSKVRFNGAPATVQSGDDNSLIVKAPISSDGTIQVEPTSNTEFAPPKNKTIAVSGSNFHYDVSVIQDPSFTLFYNDTDSAQHVTGGSFSAVDRLFYNFGWGFVFPTGLEPLPKAVASFGLRNDSSQPFPVTIDLAKTAPLPQDMVPTNMVCLPDSVTLQPGVRSNFDIRFESTDRFPINSDPSVANRYVYQVTIRLNSPAFGFPVQLGIINAGITDY